LLNWAYGGKCPAEISHLEGRMRSMADTFRQTGAGAAA
jgi:hypothetical protein